jgi:hypothetical protein
MAKKKRSRRRPSVPAPKAAPRQRPKGPGAEAPVAPSPASEDLEAQYHYVRRDLTRIVVIAVVLMAAIVASQYLFI